MKLLISVLNNRVKRYSLSGSMVMNEEIQYEIETEMDLDKILYCDYIDGELHYNEDYIVLDRQNKIRENREINCFPIVNRGQPWYNTLSTEQIVEIQTWYQAWLDAPQTFVEPETPVWLKDREI